MLTRFRVRNYRGFHETVTLDLGNPRDYAFNSEYVTDGVINNALVIGENASGKTNLIRAIADVSTNYYAPGMGTVVAGDESFVNADGQEPFASFEYTFRLLGKTVVYAYTKGSDRRLRKERLVVDDSVVFDYDAESGRLLDSDLDAVGAEDLNWVFSSDYSSALAYLSSNAPVKRGDLLDELRASTTQIYTVVQDGLGSSRTVSRCLADIIRKDRVKELEKFLRDFGIDERLRVHEDADGSRAIYCEHVRPIPFAECMSSGTRTLALLFYVYEMGDQGRLFLLDEFDAYCHFEVAERLVRYFGTASRRQTISTTHNTSLTRNGVMRPDCIFKFDDRGTLAPLSERTARELRMGNNIERLLRNGEFD